MFSIACFIAVGLVLGLLVPLRGFALFSLFVLAAYAALTSGFSGLGSVYDAIFAWVALQVGYFLAVLTYLVWPLLLERTVRGPPVEPKLKPRDRDETSPPNSSLPQ
jgi:hypothetical protein